MTVKGLKQIIENLYDEGLGPIEITRRSGSTRGYVDYVLRFHRSSSPRTSSGTPSLAACDARHLLAVARASNNKGFPYCVAGLSTAKVQIGGQTMDRDNNALRTIAQSRP